MPLQCSAKLKNGRMKVLILKTLSLLKACCHHPQIQTSPHSQPGATLTSTDFMLQKPSARNLSEPFSVLRRNSGVIGRQKRRNSEIHDVACNCTKINACFSKLCPR